MQHPVITFKEKPDFILRKEKRGLSSHPLPARIFEKDYGEQMAPNPPTVLQFPTFTSTLRVNC